MKMKTRDLIDNTLDWAVATAEGYTDLRQNPHKFASPGELIITPPRTAYGPVWFTDYQPSADWEKGGPIIQEERMHLFPVLSAEPARRWMAWMSGVRPFVIEDGYFGPTVLVAAMRCYVASKLGDEIDVPEVLL